MEKLLCVYLILMAAQSSSAESLRPLSTNRPSKTEVATTVDVRHFQFESDFISFARESKVETTSLAATQVRYGIATDTEFQLTVVPYIHRTSLNGPGDTVLGVKQCWYGNGDAPFTIGTVFYTLLPTSQEQLGYRDGALGLEIPWSTDLPAGFDLLGMVKWERQRNAYDTGNVDVFDLTAFVGHSVAEKWYFYGELFSRWRHEEGAARVSTFDLGATYLVHANLQLDIGLAFGMTPAADDFASTLGISYRL